MTNGPQQPGWGPPQQPPPQQPGWGPPPPPQGPPQPPAWGTPPPKPPGTRPWYRKKRFIIPIAVVALFFVLGVVGAIVGPPDDTGLSAPATTAEPAPTVTDAPATTVQATTTIAPVTTAAPTTTAPATTLQGTTTAAPTTAKPQPIPLRQVVGNALGSSNRGKNPRPDQWDAPFGHTIILRWAIDDNLTEGLVKSGARLEVVKILKAIRSHPDWTTKKYPGVTMSGTFTLVNDLGEESEDVVIRAHYDRATINRMNFDNIDFHRILNVADPVFIHPTFQE